MYQPDLSQRKAFPNSLYVGWLEKGQPFVRGEVSEDFKRRLFFLCAKSIKTRGFHTCSFCAENQERKMYLLEGKSVSLGSSEFQVRGRHWKNYLAPDLIYHYVVEHQYKPPGEFIEAVLHPRRFLTFDFLLLTVLLCVGIASILAIHLTLSTLLLMFLPIALCFLIIAGTIIVVRFLRRR